MDLGLTGKTALVTGSYRGTGEAIATVLAEEGAHVLVHGFEEEPARAAAGRIAEAGHNASPVWGDILTDAGADALAAQCAEAGGVDILVNNYGTADRGKWADRTSADWIDAYEKNVLSAVRMTTRLMEGMKAKGWGRIIQLGTIGSAQPAARMPHYYAAKGALATLTVSLAQDLAGTGITVNLVSPGLIRTREVEEYYLALGQKKGWGSSWEEVEPHVVATFGDIPLGRIPTPREVAAIVAFAASGPASALHGVNIRVDGGTARLVT